MISSQILFSFVTYIATFCVDLQNVSRIIQFSIQLNTCSRIIAAFLISRDKSVLQSQADNGRHCSMHHQTRAVECVRWTEPAPSDTVSRPFALKYDLRSPHCCPSLEIFAPAESSVCLWTLQLLLVANTSTRPAIWQLLPRSRDFFQYCTSHYSGSNPSCTAELRYRI